MSHDTSTYLRINEIKNYLYCPRIAFYALCLRIDRETGLSQMGIQAEAKAKQRVQRRKGAIHAIHQGIRHFDVPVISHHYRLIGKLDEVVETETGLYLIDYKDTSQDYGYWQVQMCAYQVCVQELKSTPVLGCYIYSIPTQKYSPVKITPRDLQYLLELVERLDQLLISEVCPEPTPHIAKCRSCQYARFCNDVF